MDAVEYPEPGYYASCDALAAAPDGTFYAVRTEWAPDESLTTWITRSMDGGATWQDVSSPGQ